MARKLTSAHAQCFAVTTRDGRELICRKSKGHDLKIPASKREHYDPSAGKRWIGK